MSIKLVVGLIKRENGRIKKNEQIELDELFSLFRKTKAYKAIPKMSFLDALLNRKVKASEIYNESLLRFSTFMLFIIKKDKAGNNKVDREALINEFDKEYKDIYES